MQYIKIMLLLLIQVYISEKIIIESKNKIENSTVLFKLKDKFILSIDENEETLKNYINNYNNDYTKNSLISIDAIEYLEYPGLWGIDNIDNKNDFMYSYNYTGKGVTVYVVDSGISNHSEFINNGVSRIIDRKTFISDNPDYYDCNGHGTHVASIIGGNVCGVSKKVNIVSAKIFNCKGQGTTYDLIEALSWISKQKKGIINLSISGEKLYIINDIINNLVKKGFVVVSAAGNNGKNVCDYTPASAELSITVGCIEQDNKSCIQSNEGGCISLFAPGSNILGANIHGGFILKSGTSMSTSFVSGIAAQIKQRFPKMKSEKIKKIITTNSLNNSLILRDPASPNLNAKLLR